jgi:hypothetical protein
MGGRGMRVRRGRGGSEKLEVRSVNGLWGEGRGGERGEGRRVCWEREMRGDVITPLGYGEDATLVGLGICWGGHPR